MASWGCWPEPSCWCRAPPRRRSATSARAKPFFDSRADARARRPAGGHGRRRAPDARHLAGAELPAQPARPGRRAERRPADRHAAPAPAHRRRAQRAARGRPHRHRARLRARQPRRDRPRRLRPRRPRRAAPHDHRARADRRALPPALPRHPGVRQRPAGRDRPRRARALRGGLAAARPRRRLDRAGDRRRRGARRAAAQRRRPAQPGGHVRPARRPAGHELRRRRLRPARAVRRRERRAARVARDLPGELGRLYDAVVDASSGAILYRANLTRRSRTRRSTRTIRARRRP